MTWENYVKQMVNEHTDIDKLSLRVGRTYYDIYGFDELTVYCLDNRGVPINVFDVMLSTFSKRDDYLHLVANDQGVIVTYTIFYKDVEKVTKNSPIPYPGI